VNASKTIPDWLYVGRAVVLMNPQTFQDLLVWQDSHSLVLSIYLATSKYPRSELFGLVSQMRRAAVSVAANIVEGYKRKSPTEKAHFYNFAQASLEELKYFLILSRDLGYIGDYDTLNEHAELVSRRLYRFIEGIPTSSRRR
jgi:four helix bundle protein